MYLECQLVFKSYKPLRLEKGMFFLTDVPGGHAIRELTEVPRNEEEFVQLNGYPVEPYVVDIGNPNLNEEIIIATPEQIGWFDEGEHSDELSDISVKNINDILEHFEGWIDVEMQETEDGEYIPLLYNNKITIRLPEDYDDDEWDDDIDDDDDYGPPDPEEKYWRDAQTWSERHSNTDDDDYNAIY